VGYIHIEYALDDIPDKVFFSPTPTYSNKPDKEEPLYPVKEVYRKKRKREEKEYP
jgi:hypothetical protein